MLVTHGISPSSDAPQAVTVGNFDGVHRGHRAMLDRLVARARAQGLRSCVLTFEPHPREFFSPASAPARLSRLREKLEAFAQAGVGRVHVARFDAALARIGAERFVAEVLARGLRTAHLLVGPDFRFGAGREGDVALLAARASAYGFELEPMPEVREGDERVSSSAVRAALAAGDFARAARLLGRPYAMSGRVAHGARLGRALGFPTANIVLRRQPPLAGVYVVEVEIEETQGRYRGAASVGRRPTVVAAGPLLLEVHLLGFAGSLYGRHLRVTFLQKLREEQAYDGLERLREAIALDVRRAEAYFACHG